MTTINEIKFDTRDSFKISTFGNDTLENLRYGVIMPDGLVIECHFGGHTVAYNVGITLYILNHCPEKFYDKTINLTEYIAENSKNNILENPYELSFTSYGLSQQLAYYKENEPELYSIIEKATFINAKNTPSDYSQMIKDHALEWLHENAKYIWAIRVFYLMKTDDHFWDDNEYPEWLNLMWKLFEIEFEKYETQYKKYTVYDQRTQLKEDIVNFFNKDQQKKIENIIDVYPTYREILGYNPSYGSFWHHNFVDTDLDYLIFEKFNPTIEN